jgi:acyl-CoA thioesterase-2
MPDEQPTRGLMRLFELTPLDDDVWSGISPSSGWGRLYGGQVASQALRAASLTVEPGRLAHSVHAYFILPGHEGVDLRLEVQRTRDGRSFSTRHVRAKQDDRTILEMIASFHADEDELDWQPEPPADLVPPDELRPLDVPQLEAVFRSFDIRPTSLRGGGLFPLVRPFWVRINEDLPEDPTIHECLLLHISDMSLVETARAPGATKFLEAGASLDHAMWFHRPARADEWLLYSVEPTSNYGGRGLAKATLRTEDGSLVATVAQEALLRGDKRNP